MRSILFAFVLALPLSEAVAHDFKMRVGQDTYVFDYNYSGKSIDVYESRPNEPYSDRMESIMHDWFALQDIIGAIPNALSGMKASPPLAIGRTGDIGVNAFAAIYAGKRYIVMSNEIHSNYAMMALVMGHELGHHVCGHTSGVLSGNPWEKELEADRFAGVAVRSGSFGIDLNSALNYAAQLFSTEGSTSHPPAAMRLNAIQEGYNNGSTCIGRTVGPVASTELGGQLRPVEPLWGHNGSTVRLIADGASRRFVYETPREGLASAGIAKGTLLFKGRKNGNTYSGTAYVFSRCGPKPYAVTGTVSDDQRTVTLFGQAPIVGSNCAISSFNSDTLTFNFQGD